MPRVASQAGSRMANSETPNSLIEAACAQKDKGGLPQNGTPGSNQGVIQSPVSAIRRAISAYRGSVVSANGKSAMPIKRLARMAARTRNQGLRSLRMAVVPFADVA